MAVCLSGSSVCLSACLPVRALNLTPFSVLFIRVPYYLGAKKGPQFGELLLSCNQVLACTVYLEF